MKRKLVVSSLLVVAGLAALASLVLPNLLRARIPAAAVDELPPYPAPLPPVAVEPVAPAPGPVPAPPPEVRAQAPAEPRLRLPRAADVDTPVREAEEVRRGLASKAGSEQGAGRFLAQVGAPPPPPASAPAGLRAREMKKDERDYFAPPAGFNREAYDHIRDNPFLAAASNPLSTFSIDVDTASYANVRRFLTAGQLPPKDAVRIEELVNYFRYDYPEPEGDLPFSISTEVGRCPWKPEHRLALVGLRGRSLDEESLPPRNLTFLLDVSGSMNSPDKLPLLKRAMGVLVDTLREEDRVAIVVYAGASGLVLSPTSGAGRGEILAALDSLRAGGSTAGGAGIELAYRVATDNYVEGGINRVILATDGDFNVGVSSEGDLVRLIEQKRETGVFLSVLGFGRGNIQDSKMEKLADHGNGNYSYIDSFREARKVLGTEAGGTLVTTPPG
jgi:Ca-activated chloride channel family protein